MERLTKVFFGLITIIGIAWLCLIVWFLFSVIGIARNALAEEFNITTTTIVINWYDSELELQDALDDSNIAGLSDCEFIPKFGVSFCELWLVRPIAVSDDYAFDTIGHEFYHAVAGDFHHD